jgi:hypothetical protein
VFVAEGWGVLIQLEHADDLLWHVVAIGSFDVD